MPLMSAYALACLQFDNVALLFPQIAAQIFIVVNLAQKTDALRVLAMSTGQMLTLSYLAYLVLYVVPDGKNDLRQLLFLVLPLAL